MHTQVTLWQVHASGKLKFGAISQAYHSARCKVEGTLNGLLQLLYLSVMLSLMCVIDIPVMGLEKMGNGKNEMAHLPVCVECVKVFLETPIPLASRTRACTVSSLFEALQ